MRILKFVALGVFVLVLVALLGIVSVNRLGRTAAVPTEDPAARLNREHADLPGNAAPIYAQAFEAMVGTSVGSGGWNGWQRGDPVPPEALDWLEANGPALQFAREAASQPALWFASKDWPEIMGQSSKLRSVSLLLLWEGRLASERRDPQRLAECVLALDGMRRQIEMSPWILARLTGLSIASLVQSIVLDPCAWTELDGGSRAAYLECVRPAFDPPAPLTSAIDVETELSVWAFPHAAGAATWLITPARYGGELNWYLAPIRELSTLGVEDQADPGHPLWAEYNARIAQAVPVYRIARGLASITVPSIAESLMLHVRAAAAQRGNKAVAALFTWREQTGEWPEDLRVLEGDFTIDPYSRRPFVYRREGDSFTLYSVGLDRDDDGGQHDSRFGGPRGSATQPDGDHVFWPLPTGGE